MTVRSLLLVAVLVVAVFGTAGTMWSVAHGANGCPTQGSPLAQQPVCMEPRP